MQAMEKHATGQESVQPNESCSYAATDKPNTGPSLQGSRCLQHHQLLPSGGLQHAS